MLAHASIKRRLFGAGIYIAMAYPSDFNFGM